MGFSPVRVASPGQLVDLSIALFLPFFAEEGQESLIENRRLESDLWSKSINLSQNVLPRLLRPSKKEVMEVIRSLQLSLPYKLTRTFAPALSQRR